jgi:CubicO group peptidase (beta-lactamase class C family)
LVWCAWCGWNDAHVPLAAFALIVILDYQIHWATSYDVSQIASGTPVGTGTLFQAASISKPATAMAVMQQD